MDSERNCLKSLSHGKLVWPPKILQSGASTEKNGENVQLLGSPCSMAVLVCPFVTCFE